MIDLKTDIQIQDNLQGMTIRGSVEEALLDGKTLLNNTDRLEEWLLDSPENILKTRGLVSLMEQGASLSGDKGEEIVLRCAETLETCIQVTLSIMLIQSMEDPYKLEFVQQMNSFWNSDVMVTHNN